MKEGIHYEKRLASLVSIVVIYALLSGSIVFAQDNMFDFSNVAYGDTTEIFEAPSLFDVDPSFKAKMLAKQSAAFSQKQVLASAYPTDGMPDVVDQSQSEYFPPVQNQGSIGACASFATTYYQFTFAKNQFLDVATTQNNASSPQFTYNLLCHGNAKGGSARDENYELLKMFGALSWQDFPFVNSADGCAVWPSNTVKMREAMDVRLENYYQENLNTSTTPITYTDDWDLLQLKYLLGTGYLLTFSTYAAWDTKYSSQYGSIIIRGFMPPAAERQTSGHAMTVVGYNDDVCFDVNGNGVIEEAEKGAFKVVNSWGPYWGNNGFIWVLYDSMNAVSQISGNWEAAYSTERNVFFSKGGTTNSFSYIRVANTKPLFIGELTVTASDQSKLAAHHTSTQQFSDQDDFKFKRYTAMYTQSKSNKSFTGKLLFPFDDEQILSTTAMQSLQCLIKVTDLKNNGAATLSNLSYRITDNLGKTVYSYGSFIGSKQIIHTFDMSTRGDVNYDGIINATDAQFVLKMAVNNVTYSYAQAFFADYDKNGVVDANDALKIMQHK